MNKQAIIRLLLVTRCKIWG